LGSRGDFLLAEWSKLDAHSPEKFWSTKPIMGFILVKKEKKKRKVFFVRTLISQTLPYRDWVEKKELRS